jgi:Bacterial cadherin-like domain
MTAINLSAPETYLEDTPLNLADIVITDSVIATATLTLSDAAAGALTTGTSGAVTSTYDSATGIWIASGPIADVNALLAAVTFIPAENFNDNFVIATSVSDDTGTATGSKLITGTPVNDAPIAADDSGTTFEDTALTGAILANDSDVEGTALTAFLTSPPANGTVTLDTDTGAFVYTP